jgi:S-formylglutathione hydrolase FrmB
MALAMPSDGLWGDGSGYLPHGGQDFEKWIVEDVPAAVREAVPQVDSASPLFITGLSMGGYGALRLAAAHPTRFRAASGHSSITHLDQMPIFVEEDIACYRQDDPEAESVLALLLRNRADLPPVRFDCGADDLLIEHNRTLHRELDRHGVPHLYCEYPGGHTWPYWAEHIVDTLRFFDTHLS